MQKTVEIVGLAKDFVGSVASAEPHAAIAWTGVCFLLPASYSVSQAFALAFPCSSRKTRCA